MKPLVNIDQLDNVIEREDGPFKEQCAVKGLYRAHLEQQNKSIFVHDAQS